MSSLEHLQWAVSVKQPKFCRLSCLLYSQSGATIRRDWRSFVILHG